jgi:hypothetical protein
MKIEPAQAYFSWPLIVAKAQAALLRCFQNSTSTSKRIPSPTIAEDPEIQKELLACLETHSIEAFSVMRYGPPQILVVAARGSTDLLHELLKIAVDG